METVIQLNSNAKLSEHFTLGELTKSSSHPEVYNIPSHEAIANLKRVCTWLEELRKRYNAKYCLSSRPCGLSSRLSEAHGEISGDVSTPLDMTPPLSSRLSEAHGEISEISRQARNDNTPLDMTPPLSSRPCGEISGDVSTSLDMTKQEEPIRINSGYRSPQLNKKIGGVPTSNHLTGCAVDIRVSGMEQLIVYAAIIIQYANETHQDFDELLIEKNRHGAIWLHFAVKPNNNRRHVLFLNG